MLSRKANGGFEKKYSMSFLIFKVPEPYKRALQPKQLQQRSIKTTAAYSTDRSVLFEFITLIRLLLFKRDYMIKKH
jgi:hypothetical protein